MIRQKHQIARPEVEVHTTGGVGQHQLLHADGRQHPNGQRDLPLGQSLVIMDPSLKDHHLLTRLLPEDQGAAVPGDGR